MSSSGMLSTDRERPAAAAVVLGLPNDVLAAIFERVGVLSAAGPCSLDTVSRQFRHVVREISVWPAARDEGRLDLSEAAMRRCGARRWREAPGALAIAATRRLGLWATAGRLRGVRRLTVALFDAAHARAVGDLLALLAEGSPDLRLFAAALVDPEGRPSVEVNVAVDACRFSGIPTCTLAMGRFPALEHLDLSRGLTLRGIDGRSVRSLQRLQLPRAQPLDGRDAASLAAEAPGLRELRCGAAPSALPQLARLPLLEDLDVVMDASAEPTAALGGDPFVAGLAALGPPLRVLRLGGRGSAPVSAAGLAGVARIATLRTLSLQVDVDSSNGLPTLARLPNLRELLVRGRLPPGVDQGERVLHRLSEGLRAAPALREVSLDFDFELEARLATCLAALLRSLAASRAALVRWRSSHLPRSPTASYALQCAAAQEMARALATCGPGLRDVALEFEANAAGPATALLLALAPLQNHREVFGTRFSVRVYPAVGVGPAALAQAVGAFPFATAEPRPLASPSNVNRPAPADREADLQRDREAAVGVCLLM